MPAWLMLSLLVLVFAALLADHRRNTTRDLTEVESHDTVRPATHRPLARPSVRHGRTHGRPADVSRSGALRLTRGTRVTKRR